MTPRHAKARTQPKANPSPLKRLTDEFLAANGWDLGNNSEKPWMRTISPLALYFEEYTLDADIYEAEVPCDESFFITFDTNRSYADQIKVESSDASVEIVSSAVSNDNHSLVVEVIVKDGGKAVLTATLGDLSLEVSVKHNGMSAVEEIAAESSSIYVENDAVLANGDIKVYNVAGMLVAEGTDKVSVKALPAEGVCSHLRRRHTEIRKINRNTRSNK